MKKAPKIVEALHVLAHKFLLFFYGVRETFTK